MAPKSPQQIQTEIEQLRQKRAALEKERGQRLEQAKNIRSDTSLTAKQKRGKLKGVDRELGRVSATITKINRKIRKLKQPGLITTAEGQQRGAVKRKPRPAETVTEITTAEGRKFQFTEEQLRNPRVRAFAERKLGGPLTGRDRTILETSTGQIVSGKVFRQGEREIFAGIAPRTDKPSVAVLEQPRPPPSVSFPKTISGATAEALVSDAANTPRRTIPITGELGSNITEQPATAVETSRLVTRLPTQKELFPSTIRATDPFKGVSVEDRTFLDFNTQAIADRLTQPAKDAFRDSDIPSLVKATPALIKGKTIEFAAGVQQSTQTIVKDPAGAGLIVGGTLLASKLFPASAVATTLVGGVTAVELSKGVPPAETLPARAVTKPIKTAGELVPFVVADAAVRGGVAVVKDPVVRRIAGNVVKGPVFFAASAGGRGGGVPKGKGKGKGKGKPDTIPKATKADLRQLEVSTARIKQQLAVEPRSKKRGKQPKQPTPKLTAKQLRAVPVGEAVRRGKIDITLPKELKKGKDIRTIAADNLKIGREQITKRAKGKVETLTETEQALVKQRSQLADFQIIKKQQKIAISGGERITDKVILALKGRGPSRTPKKAREPKARQEPKRRVIDLDKIISRFRAARTPPTTVLIQKTPRVRGKGGKVLKFRSDELKFKLASVQPSGKGARKLDKARQALDKNLRDLALNANVAGPAESIRKDAFGFGRLLQQQKARKARQERFIFDKQRARRSEPGDVVPRDLRPSRPGPKGRRFLFEEEEFKFPKLVTETGELRKGVSPGRERVFFRLQERLKAQQLARQAAKPETPTIPKQELPTNLKAGSPLKSVAGASVAALSTTRLSSLSPQRIDTATGQQLRAATRAADRLDLDVGTLPKEATKAAQDLGVKSLAAQSITGGTQAATGTVKSAGRALDRLKPKPGQRPLTKLGGRPKLPRLPGLSQVPKTTTTRPPVLPRKLSDYGTAGAYSVLVKVKGQFQKVKAPPLTRAAARALGAEITGGSALRTFRVTPAQGVARPTTAQEERASRDLLRKFREKQGSTFVERTKFAIDTPGELRQITEKGIRANRRTVKRLLR